MNHPVRYYLIGFLLLGSFFHSLAYGQEQTAVAPAKLGNQVATNPTPAAQPEFFVRGKLQQGGFMIGRVPPLSPDKKSKDNVKSVIYGGRELSLSPGDETKKIPREFFIAFDREDPLEQEITFVLANNSKLIKKFQIQKSIYDIQSLTGLNNQYVNPNVEQVALINSQNKQIVELRKTSDETNFSPLQTFIWPAEARISGVYGSQRILNGEPRTPHYGVDLALKIGTPVRAPQSGKVVLAQKFFMPGNIMVIDHGIGVQSIFMHLDHFQVKEGDIVKQGQVIAMSGNSGRTTAPHLHWQVNWYGKKFNAQLLPKNTDLAKN